MSYFTLINALHRAVLMNSEFRMSQLTRKGVSLPTNSSLFGQADRCGNDRLARYGESCAAGLSLMMLSEAPANVTSGRRIGSQVATAGSPGYLGLVGR